MLATLKDVGDRLTAEKMRQANAVHVATLKKELDTRIGIVSADAERMRQVLRNLVTNAVKYTPAGGHIDVRLTGRDGVVRVIVCDTGSGIERALLPHVFERFRQGDWRKAGVQGGLGLGLAIVREIVELHGGAVAVHSDGPGTGATFTVDGGITAAYVTPE